MPVLGEVLCTLACVLPSGGAAGKPASSHGLHFTRGLRETGERLAWTPGGTFAVAGVHVGITPTVGFEGIE